MAGVYILDAVEDDLFADAVFLQQGFDIQQFHVPGLDLERIQAGAAVAVQAGHDAERLIGPNDGDEDVALVDDVAADHAMHDVRWHHRPLLGEEKTGAGDVLPLGVNLFVGQEKGFHVQGPQRPVQRPLPLGPE